MKAVWGTDNQGGFPMKTPPWPSTENVQQQHGEWSLLLGHRGPPAVLPARVLDHPLGHGRHFPSPTEPRHLEWRPAGLGRTRVSRDDILLSVSGAVRGGSELVLLRPKIVSSLLLGASSRIVLNSPAAKRLCSGSHHADAFPAAPQGPLHNIPLHLRHVSASCAKLLQGDTTTYPRF